MDSAVIYKLFFVSHYVQKSKNHVGYQHEVEKIDEKVKPVDNNQSIITLDYIAKTLLAEILPTI